MAGILMITGEARDVGSCDNCQVGHRIVSAIITQVSLCKRTFNLCDACSMTLLEALQTHKGLTMEIPEEKINDLKHLTV